MFNAPRWPDGVTTEIRTIAGGVLGVRQTLGLMRAIVNEYKCDPYIRETAATVVFLQAPKSQPHEAVSIYEFVRDAIRYTRDVNGVETLQTPDRTLQMRIGDCDDKTILLCALLESVGFATRFVVTGYSIPNVLEHVYCECLIDGEWIAMDSTEHQYIGWEPPEPVTLFYESV